MRSWGGEMLKNPLNLKIKNHGEKERKKLSFNLDEKKNQVSANYRGLHESANVYRETPSAHDGSHIP